MNVHIHWMDKNKYTNSWREKYASPECRSYCYVPRSQTKLFHQVPLKSVKPSGHKLRDESTHRHDVVLVSRESVDRVARQGQRDAPLADVTH